MAEQRPVEEGVQRAAWPAVFVAVPVGGQGVQSSAPESQPLVELGQRGGAEPRAAIELVVGARYVLRLWPSMRAGHLREVLAGLEDVR